MNESSAMNEGLRTGGSGTPVELSTDEVAGLLEEVADTVIEPHFGVLSKAEIHQKSHPGDLVTDADRQAERVISARLRHLTGAVVVGEEAAFTDPTILDALPGADQAWVIDPIDGTSNFVKGSDDHAVMLAEVRSGRTVRGWIWQPRHRHMYIAESGAGLYRDGVRITRGPAGDPVVAATTHRSFQQTVAPEGGPRLEWTWSRWCCGVDYPRLCTGEVDATVYLHSHPWDHLSGALMLRELGGVVRTLSGHDFGVKEFHRDPLIVASDEPAYRAVADALIGLGVTVR
ncbi:MAG: inositol monophosphatase [Acidipropionibacterium jensenii]|nr:inositol monophosphatase [Acidipropionibacterium jensenii]MDN5995376.1 inositol monophosphatase [Acidipropionibacterium jensenii]MDN6425869.1 inositol monophosphatase [Acidipropionibacterium jensenii]MDN6442580.1 inositol monophosphatase [Acidipropionibacterium jensenii]MDN6512052.1 inositol monophosphatase [Acidipropionibacterium jensenii]MDN6791248.1 inositol monophosphatase [Acidipropionibacterium jensenii]